MKHIFWLAVARAGYILLWFIMCIRKCDGDMKEKVLLVGRGAGVVMVILTKGMKEEI